jgi:hypothetical protein
MQLTSMADPRRVSPYSRIQALGPFVDPLNIVIAKCMHTQLCSKMHLDINFDIDSRSFQRDI